MEKNPIHEVTFNLQCVCVQAASSPRLFVVVVYSVTLTVGRGEGEKSIWQYLHNVFRNVPIYFIILAKNSLYVCRYTCKNISLRKIII